MCAILCGLTVAQDFRRGQQLIADRDFSDLAEFFQDAFEVGLPGRVVRSGYSRWVGGSFKSFLQDAFEVCGSAGGGWDGWVGASLVGWVGQLAWVG